MSTVQPVSQSEIAYQRLRESILSARILPGEHLAEIKWADTFEVGRFAIREGLRRLHGEGLVTRSRGRYRVTIPAAKDVQEIGHLRAVLETGAIRFISQKKLPSRLLAPIRRAAADYAALVKNGYLAGAQEADLRFHQSIIAASQNPRLIRLYEASNLPLLQVSISKAPFLLDDYQKVIREHARICEALENGDWNRASRFLEQHLKRGVTTILGTQVHD